VAFWRASRPASAIWEAEIRAFEHSDQRQAPPKHGILFVGSSSIRLWHTLPQDFPGYRIIKRGFGGSHIADVTAFVDRIVVPYEPRMVLLYAGDNDLADGKSPEQVVKDFQEFVAAVHAALPKTRISFISIKPSLARWPLLARIWRTSRLIYAFTRTTPLVTYIDIYTPMLDANGRLKTKYFTADGLHLNAKGYALWAAVIRTKLPPTLTEVAAAPWPPRR
jgi:lysophospholipase L1-like esterase